MKQNLLLGIGAIVAGAMIIGTAGVSEASPGKNQFHSKKRGHQCNLRGDNVYHNRGNKHGYVYRPAASPYSYQNYHRATYYPYRTNVNDRARKRARVRKQARQKFAILDRNRDGRLSQREYVRGMKQRYYRRGDYRLSRNKRRALRRKFQRMDRNHNGVVTFREFAKWNKKNRRPHWRA